MESTVTERMNDTYNTIVYSPVILKYANLLTTATQIYEVEPHIGTRYIGDLYGLFNFLGIDRSKWLLLLRVNKISSPTRYRGESITIIDYATDDLYSALKLELSLNAS